MNTELEINFLWVPHDLGGHRAEPYGGMRPTIRWQRHLQEHLSCARDVECTWVRFDPTCLRGTARFRLISDALIPPEWLRKDNLIELLDGYTVIAVGRVV